MQAFLDKKALVNTLLAATNEKRRAMVEGVLADTMRPLHEWPEHCIRLLLTKHLRYNGIVAFGGKKQFTRFEFVCFLLGNGMSPETLADWCLAEPGYLRHDKSCSDVAGIIDKHGKGDLEQYEFWCMDKIEMYDPATNRTTIVHGSKQNCSTPGFAFDHEGRRAAMLVWSDKGPLIKWGKPIYRVEYQEPGSRYWEKAVEALTNAGKKKPRKQDVPISGAPQHYCTGAASSSGSLKRKF